MNEPPRDSVVILGAGISGLSAAWRLSEAGIPVTVLESAPFPGGLAATAVAGPYRLDFGPHSFFSDDEEIRRTVLELFDGNLPQIPRSVKLFYRGAYLDYPFTPAGLLSKMPFFSVLQTFGSYLVSRFRLSRPAHEDKESVEGWAINTFGAQFYRAFFKPYTEQFWKIPASELSARSIPSHTRLSFGTALRSLFKKKTAEGSVLDREKLPTYYPSLGYGEIAEKIAAKIIENGGKILYSSRVLGIVREGEAWRVSFLSGTERDISAARVISTVPVSTLPSLLEMPREIHAAAKALEFRPILVLGIVTSKQALLKGAYMYTLDRPYNRLSEMNRFSSATSPEGENILALEIPCTQSDWHWNAREEELFEICLPFLEKDGVLKREDVKGLLLVKSPHAYPVYRIGYRPLLQQVLGYLETMPGFHTLGRSGEFIYMDADRCMRRAFDLVKKIQSESVRDYAAT